MHRRVAEILRDRFADKAAAEPEVLAHHFTQAGLTDAAIEWWGKAGDQALRRSAFQEAIAHLGKAIEMADKAAGGKALLAELGASEPVAAELKRRETRSKLHAGYALATMMTKGFAAEETKATLARAASAPGAVRTPEYWTLVYGRINADMMHGDHRAARAGAEAFLAEAEAAGLPGHAAFARRMLGSSSSWPAISSARVRTLSGRSPITTNGTTRALGRFSPSTSDRTPLDISV